MITHCTSTTTISTSTTETTTAMIVVTVPTRVVDCGIVDIVGHEHGLVLVPFAMVTPSFNGTMVSVLLGIMGAVVSVAIVLIISVVMVGLVLLLLLQKQI